MSNDDPIAPAAKTLTAKVIKTLPNSRYRVSTEHGEEIEAHVSGKMRMKFIRILPGERVQIEVSPFDRNLGRITGLL